MTMQNREEDKKELELHYKNNENHSMNMKDNTINKDARDPKQDKPLDYVAIAKRVYVIVALVIGFGILGLKSVSDPVDDWLDETQADIVSFLMGDSAWWLILIILILGIVILTFMKAVSIKDVFSLRTIVVSILAMKITHGDKVGALCLAMLIMGILSSISKIAEYRVIGKEIQFIIGTPTKFIMKWLKFIMTKLCKINEEKLEFFDTKYTLEISYKSRTDRKMSIINNFQYRYGSGVDEDNPRTIQWYASQAAVWLGAVLWTMCVEWVQPITELFLFAHNWRMSPSNVLIIVLAEFVDIDKAVETWYVIGAIATDGDIIGAKVDQLWFKVCSWAFGYSIVLFPTLLWAYKYYKTAKDENGELVMNQEADNKEERELSSEEKTDTKASSQTTDVMVVMR